MIEAWVDGSFTGGRCGWAFVVLEDGEFLYEDYGDDVPSEYFTHRNIAGEVYAVRNLIDFCVSSDIESISIYYDYSGLEAWATGKFKTNKEMTKEYKAYIDQSGIQINWIKVEGHTGDTWNEYVDKLAGLAAGKIKNPPELPVSNKIKTEINTETTSNIQPQAAENFISDEAPVDISTIKRVDMRKLMEEQIARKSNDLPKDSENKTESAPVEIEVAEPLESVAQSNISEDTQKLNETKAIVTETVAAAKSLPDDKLSVSYKLTEAKGHMDSGDYITALGIIKPLLSSALSDDEIALYIKCLHNLGEKNAKKAVKYAEKCLTLRPAAIPILREYSRALITGFISPVVCADTVKEQDYNLAKESACKLMAIGKGSRSIAGMLLPFIRIAYRLQDRDFLQKVASVIPPETFSEKTIVVNNINSISKREEYKTYIKKL